MKFSAIEYYRAALERMAQARHAHRTGGSYALAMYLSGLAVECLLRAFRWSEDARFEGRHDLTDLLKQSQFLTLDEANLASRGFDANQIAEASQSIRAAMSEVVALWHNSLRFASEASLRAYLRRIDRLAGIRGDALKKNSLDLLNAAQTVIDRGIRLWTFRKD
jgi:hypothetical protein